MTFRKSRDALARALSQTKDAAQQAIPAANIRDQLAPRALPPASGTTRGGVVLSDADPLANDPIADPGASSAASRADHVHPDSGGGSSLTIEEVDGTPSEAAPTKLIFPNGTLGVVSNEVTYTPAGGGSATINTGADASKGTGTSGDLYLPSDGVQIYRSTGAAQAPWGPIFGLTDPTLQTFAWINQGGASVDTTYGGIFLSAPVNSGQNMRIRKKGAPATPYVIDVMIDPLIVSVDYQLISLGWRHAAGGALMHLRWGYVSALGGFVYSAIHSSGPTADVASMKNLGETRNPARFWRIADDGTNLTILFSHDAQHWVQFYAEARTSFLTAPDEVFWAVDERSNAYAAGATLMSWKEA